MADDTKNTDSGTPQQPDAAPQPPATPPTEPLPQQQPSMGQQVPPAQPQPQQPMYGAPQPQPQAFYPPAPLMQLTGGMKFAWLVVGALLGIPGIIIAWLVNVDKMPQVKSDALKVRHHRFRHLDRAAVHLRHDRVRNHLGRDVRADELGGYGLLQLRLPRILVIDRINL